MYSPEGSTAKLGFWFRSPLVVILNRQTQMCIAYLDLDTLGSDYKESSRPRYLRTIKISTITVSIPLSIKLYLD